MATFINTLMYRFNEEPFYTGSLQQPDSLSLFLKEKDDKEFTFCYLNACANWFGYMPIVSFFTGISRIVRAITTVFREISQLHFQCNDPHLLETWNALKNICRGCIEAIPLTGLFLMIFDSIRRAYEEYQISKHLSKEEEVFGVAIDGKVIYTIKLNAMNSTIKKYEEDARIKKLAGLLTTTLTEWQLRAPGDTKRPITQPLELFKSFITTER